MGDEVEALRARVTQLEGMVSRLTARIQTKDIEFSKERAQWKSERNRLKAQLREKSAA